MVSFIRVLILERFWCHLRTNQFTMLCENAPNVYLMVHVTAITSISEKLCWHKFDSFAVTEKRDYFEPSLVRCDGDCMSTGSEIAGTEPRGFLPPQRSIAVATRRGHVAPRTRWRACGIQPAIVLYVPLLWQCHLVLGESSEMFHSFAIFGDSHQGIYIATTNETLDVWILMVTWVNWWHRIWSICLRFPASLSVTSVTQ